MGEGGSGQGRCGQEGGRVSVGKQGVGEGCVGEEGEGGVCGCGEVCRGERGAFINIQLCSGRREGSIQHIHLTVDLLLPRAQSKSTKPSNLPSHTMNTSHTPTCRKSR